MLTTSQRGTSSPPHAEQPSPSTKPTSATKDWVFLTRRSLPTDPAARDLERRGRRWLVVSYILCPCHLPVTLSLLAVALGGTALGSVVVGHAGWVAVGLTALYAAVLWRGFHRIRAAKRLEAQGLRLDCTKDACTLEPIRDDRST